MGEFSSKKLNDKYNINLVPFLYQKNIYKTLLVSFTLKQNKQKNIIILMNRREIEKHDTNIC